jgi:hypothetical protein
MKMNVRCLFIIINKLSIYYNVQPAAVAVRAASSGFVGPSSKSPPTVTKVCVCKTNVYLLSKYDLNYYFKLSIVNVFYLKH